MLGVSRQAIYQAENRAFQKENMYDQVVKLVNTVRCKMPRIGTRKLYFLLKEKFVKHGVHLGRDALFKLLRARGLLIARKKTYTKTTNSKHWLKKHPNLYNPKLLHKPEQAFVSDITYIKARCGVFYLSLVTDAYSRKIMGYHLSKNMMAENVVKALKMAIGKRLTNQDIIHHSDRGLQYASSIYQKVLLAARITPSMTDGYDCYQNALAERVNGILKQEFLLYQCNTFRELKSLVKEGIQTYNSERPHLALQMRTPNTVHKQACALACTG